MDYSSLMGFPVEVIIVAIACYTLIQVVTLIVNRKKDKIEIASKDDNKSTEPHG